MQLVRIQSFRVRTLAAAVLLTLAMTACMKSAEEKYAEYMASGQEFFDNGDFANAAIQSKNAARAKPDEAEAYFRLAKANLSLGKALDAISAAQQAVRIDPDHTDASLLLAQFMVLQSQSEVVAQAEEIAQGVLDGESGNSDAMFILGAAKVRQGLPDEARQFLEESLAASPDNLRATMLLAKMEAAAGDLDAAEQLLRDSIDVAEDDKPARLALVQFYLGAQRLEDAQRECEQLISDHPKYAAPRLSLAMIHSRTGDKDALEEAYRGVSQLEDERYYAAYGQVLESHGKLSEAIAEYQAQMEQYPDHRGLRDRHVNALVRDGQVDVAEQQLDEYLEEEPNDADSRLQRVKLYMATDRTEQAAADLIWVLEHRSDSAEAHYLLAKTHLARSNRRLYVQSLEDALASDPNLIIARLELAQAMLASETPRAALDLIDAAPTEQAGLPVVVTSRVWTLIRLGEEAAAREMVDAALATGKTAELLLQDGILKTADKKLIAARVSLSESLELNPTNVRTLNTIALTYAAESGVGTAFQKVRTHVADYPESIPLQLALATWARRAQENAAAREAYEAAAKLGDTDLSLIQLARMDSADGNREGAVERLSTLLEANPDHVDALVTLGQMEEAAENWDKAIEFYGSAIERNPEHPIALNNIAYLLSSKKQDLDGALQYAQQAKEYAPDHPMIDDTLGWVFYLRGVYSTAVAHLRSAAEGLPQNSVVHYHLAMAQAKSGNVDAGQRAYEQALKLDPSVPEAEEARKVLAGEL